MQYIKQAVQVLKVTAVVFTLPAIIIIGFVIDYNLTY